MMPSADRLAHQELLRALAGLVVVVDDAVVGRQIAIELLGLAADGQRREQHVVGRALSLLRPRYSTSKESPGCARRWKSTSYE